MYVSGGKPMKRQPKASRPLSNGFQPECKTCNRFAIFKMPCDKDACIYRSPTKSIK